MRKKFIKLIIVMLCLNISFMNIVSVNTLSIDSITVEGNYISTKGVLSPEEINATIEILSTKVATDGKVTVNGKISSGAKAVSCLVTDTNEKIAYINQKASGSDGTFTFEFYLADWATSGTYTIKCGGDASNTPASTTFEYTKSEQEEVLGTIEILSTKVAADGKVTINGKISSGAKAVSCLVTDANEKIAYINQKTSNSDGTFTFEFYLADWATSGTYTVKCGADASNTPASTTFEYGKTTINRNAFMTAEVTLKINNYIPTVSGTINCEGSKTITLNLINKTDNTVIASENITEESGIFNISYTLPTLLKSKEYEVVFSCTENNNRLTNVSVLIDASILALGLTGEVSTADNVEIEANLQSVNTDLIDKNITFTGERTVSATLPNILSNAAFYVDAVGYEMVAISEPEQEPGEATIEILSTNVAADGKVTVNGKISSGAKAVSCLVTDANEKIAYINQKTSGSDGTFTFEFYLADWATSGTYTVKCGADASNTPASATFEYKVADFIKITSGSIDENGNVIVAGESSYLNSTVICTVFDENGEKIQIENELVGTDTVFTVKFTMPTWAESGTYTVECVCESLSQKMMLNYNKAIAVIEEIDIDKNENSALYTALKKENKELDGDNDGIITVAELNSMTGSVNLSNSNISDINGLQSLTQVTDLYINNNKIENIDVLSNLLNLKRLDLSNNNISQLNSIPKNLITLHIENNGIKNADVLRQCKGMVYLFADNNQIYDIEFIKVMANLKTVSMQNNSIVNVSWLGNITGLRYLNLSDNKVSDVSALENCTSLYDVRMSNNSITDISGLLKKRYSTVYINGNYVPSEQKIALNAAVKKY